MTTDAVPFSEELADRVLRAFRELRECIDSGEHPAAADLAVRMAMGRLNAERHWWGVNEATESRLAAIVGTLTRIRNATLVYAINPPRAAELLGEAAGRLRPLAEGARAARDAALCFAG